MFIPLENSHTFRRSFILLEKEVIVHPFGGHIHSENLIPLENMFTVHPMEPQPHPYKCWRKGGSWRAPLAYDTNNPAIRNLPKKGGRKQRKS